MAEHQSALSDYGRIYSETGTEMGQEVLFTLYFENDGKDILGQNYVFGFPLKAPGKIWLGFVTSGQSVIA